jgi:hypothetical protein
VQIALSRAQSLVVGQKAEQRIQRSLPGCLRSEMRLIMAFPESLMKNGKPQSPC